MLEGVSVGDTAMAKGNGKRNGKRPCAKSLANLKPPVKKGEIRNPKGINHKPTAFDRFCEMLEEHEKLTTEDGREIMLGREDQGLLKLIRKFQRGPQHELNDPNWRMAVQEILSRRMPIPREPQVVIGNVSVEHTEIAATFVQQIRDNTGREDVTSDDVWKALGAMDGHAHDHAGRGSSR